MRLLRRLKAIMSSIYRKLFVNQLKVLVIGVPNSGKSSLIPAVFEDEFKEPKKPKKSVKKYGVDNLEFIFYIINGGMQENKGKWDFHYKKCDVVIFIYDSTLDEGQGEEAKDNLSDLFYRNMWIRKNLLVLCNKNDLPGAKTCRDIILTLNLIDIVDREVACYSVSSKCLLNMNLVKDWLVEQAENNY